MRIYHMIRHKDISGVSGVGHVATVYWFSGPCILLWHTPNSPKISSIVAYQSLTDAKRIHGHAGNTEFTLFRTCAPSITHMLIRFILKQLFTYGNRKIFSP